MSVARPAGQHAAGWLNLGWKLPLALFFALILLIAASIPLSDMLMLGVVRGVILLWGGLVVAIASTNLFEGAAPVRLAWVALTVGAYAALCVPGIVSDPSKMVDALGPVAALTLAAHLGRRDLAQALRDWAFVMGLALYGALGFLAMSQVAVSFGLSFFLLVALFPPLVCEALLLLLRRGDAGGPTLWPQLAAVVVATALAVGIFSLTSLHEDTPLLVWVIFGLGAGLLLGGALMVSLLTMPLVEAVAGTREDQPGRRALARAFMELTHSSVLISLAVYLVLRLLTGAYSI